MFWRFTPSNNVALHFQTTLLILSHLFPKVNRFSEIWAGELSGWKSSLKCVFSKRKAGKESFISIPALTFLYFEIAKLCFILRFYGFVLRYKYFALHWLLILCYKHFVSHCYYSFCATSILLCADYSFCAINILLCTATLLC